MRTIRFITLATTVALAGLAGSPPALLAQSVDLDLAIQALQDADPSDVGLSVTASDAATGAALAGATVSIGLSDPSAAEAPDEVVLSGGGKGNFKVTASSTIDACRTITVKATLQQVEDEVATEICPAEGGELVYGDEETVEEFDTDTTFEPNPRGEIRSLAVRPEVVLAGETARGRVELDGMDLTADDVEPVTVSLESDDPAAASVPADVSTNQRYASFAIETGTVSDERTATITATNRGTSASATLTVRPLDIAGLVVDPSTLRYRERGKLVVRLNAPAPRRTTVALSSSRPGLLDVPDEVTIARGRREARTKVTATRRLRRPVRVVVTAAIGKGPTARTKDEVVLVRP